MQYPEQKTWVWPTLFPASQSVSQSVSVRVLKDFWKVKVDVGEGESGKTQVVPATGAFQACKGDTRTTPMVGAA